MIVGQNGDLKKFQLAQKIVAEQAKIVDIGSVDWSQTLSDLGLDELDLIELTIKLEDVFKVEIADLAISGDLNLNSLVLSLDL